MFQSVLQGRTPLHLAIEYNGDNMRMIDALQAKAEVDARSLLVKLCSDHEY